MNDRFKCRFWHKSKNRYINTEKLVLNDGTYTQVGTKQMNNGTYCSYIVNEYNTSDIIPEQCIGLKDKNGKLIYEGDLIKEPANKYPLEIYYNKGVWQTREYRKNGNNEQLLYVLINCYGVEIIGNIHENKDLLENENAVV